MTGPQTQAESAPPSRLCGAVVFCSAGGALSDDRVWGVPLWLRLIRQLQALDVGPIWLEGDVPDAVRTAAVSCGIQDVPFDRDRADARPGRYLVADAGWVLDGLILTVLAARPEPTVVVTSEGEGVRAAGAAVVTDAQLSALASTRDEKTNICQRLVERGDTALLDLADLPTYRLQLRRHLAPFAVQVESPEQRRQASDHVLDAAQKGTNDLPAQYLHPPLENALVRALVPLGVTPNLATVATIVVGLGVAALFAAGQFVLGALGAVAVGVLDGVDGKIARVTVNATRTGDVFEHIADNVYEILWYLGIGAGLVALTGNPAYDRAAWVMVAVYLLDRAALGVWKLFRTGDFHESSPWDQKFRRICGRRNNIVFLMLPFFALGYPAAGFMVALAWWSLTFVVHAVRVGHALLRGEDRPSTHSVPTAP